MHEIIVVCRQQINCCKQSSRHNGSNATVFFFMIVFSVNGLDKAHCTQQTLSPKYLSQHISLRTSARNTRSSSIPLLCVPFRRTSFARRSFSTAAPLTWNYLPPAVLNCDSLPTFKSRLKTRLFSTAFC